MYIMVNSYANVYFNVNQFYMAAIMTVPMIMLELFFMRSMYTHKKLNVLIITITLIVFVSLIIFIRRQIFVGDREFLKSMIPHHAGALLMCKYAQLEDPEVQELCKNIQQSQQSEIDFMQSKLKNMEK